MQSSKLSELLLLVIVALPFILLGYYWNALPAEVPVHWNIRGEVDRMGPKSELWLIPFLLPLLIYVLFLIIPMIDPKDKIKNMGGKYNQIKLVLTTFMSALAMYIIYSAKNASFSNPNYLVILVGILFIILGNYFKTIKPNYFLGVRTPWTLENEEVWKDTHILSGKLFLGGGVLVVLMSMILPVEVNFKFFIGVSILIALISVIYSYLRYKKLKQA